MRKIKFRGKSAITGNWVYGDYFKKWIYDSNTREQGLKHYIGWQEEDEKGEIWNEYAEVMLKTVGQYTGHKNNDGIEIYDGDILETEDQVSEVIFARIGYDCKKNGITGFGLKDNYYYGDREKEGFIELYYRNDFDTCKVVGNIHEEVEE